MEEHVTTKGYRVAHLVCDGIPQVMLVDTTNQTVMRLTQEDLRRMLVDSEVRWEG